MNLAVVLPLVGVVVAPVLTYLVARRTTSGRVNTTEASTLWEEAEKMREAYRVDAERLRERVEFVEGELGKLRVKTEECERDSRKLRAEMETLVAKESRLQRLHDECERLCERLRVLHEQDQFLHAEDEKKLQAEKDKP